MNIFITDPDSGRFVNGQTSYVAEFSEYLICSDTNRWRNFPSLFNKASLGLSKLIRV